MKTLRALLLRFVGVFSKGDRECDFTNELESHLQMQIEDNLRSGMAPEEARLAALMKLGGLEQTRQAYRERGTMPFLESLGFDLRFALRQFAKNRGFSCTAIIILALGIGASTAIFSAVNAALLKSLPYPDANRIMMVWETRRNSDPLYVTFGTFHGLNERTRSFSAMAVMKPWQPAMIGVGEPERFEGQRVSADYFRVLGISPALGRNFETADDRVNGPKVVILSHDLWWRRFAADPAIVGRQITLDGDLYTVLGVMPSSFENVLAPASEIWAPLQYDASLPADGREWGHHLQMIGRLRPGASKAEAQSEITVILHALAQMYAKGYNSSGGAPAGMLVYRLQDDLSREVKPALLAILVAVVLLLLIACVNVTNLLLARGAQRQGELAMRAALGAGPARLLQQMLTESLLLAAVGGLVGIVLARAGVRVLVALSPADLPRAGAIRVDAEAFLFALGLSALVGLLVGLIPALHASRHDPQTALKESSRTSAGGHPTTRGVLVISEVAIALVLLTCAGLLLRSVQRLFAIPPGFDSSHLLSMQVQDYGQRFNNDGSGARFFEQALQAVRRVPGVTAAGFTSELPLSGDSETNGMEYQAYPNDTGEPAFRYAVAPGYFEAMRIPLLRGRLLTEQDRAGTPGAVLISQSLAKRMFPNGDAIGQRVRMGPDIRRSDRPWFAIVGVVGDVKQTSLALNDSDAFYTTTAQWPWFDTAQSLVVRTQGDAASLAPAIRQAIWSVDKNQPIVRVATMESLVAASETQRHFVLILFEAFGLVGLLLAATGIYGILSGTVSERNREIGVRSALGASPRDILALIFRQGILLTLMGTAVGLLGAMLASRALISMLFGVSALDPITYITVVMTLLGVSAVACWAPALRAAHIDPAITLRAE